MRIQFRFILSFLIFYSLAVSLFSAPLKDIPVTVKQPNGEVLNIFASGDEFYNWLHDVDDFTIIQSPQTGYFVYAMKSGDDLIPSGFIAGKVDPRFLGIEKGLKISPEKMKLRMQEFYAKSPKDMGDAPKTGTINNLVVYIRFSGESEFTDRIAYYDSLFNYSVPGKNSMYNYFQEVSYNTLSISTTQYPTTAGTTVVSYQDSHPRTYFQPYNATTAPDGYTGGDNGSERTAREHQLLVDASNYVSAMVPTGLALDGDGDGKIDNVCFIVYGSPTGWASLLWPHRWSLYSQTVYINSKRVYDFNFQLQTSLKSSGVGVLCHEMFHSLGSPDLYHYTSNGITPVSFWDIMESNRNPPQHMGAHMKYKYGTWISSIPVISSSGTYTINPLTSSTNNCYRINSPNSSTEYFIVEYRKRNTVFENSLSACGLIIYRINSAYNGNASGPPDEVYIYRPGGTTTVNGTASTANFSSAVGRTAINDGTNPSSFLTNGNAGGLDISAVGDTGATISFTVNFTNMSYSSGTTAQASSSQVGRGTINNVVLCAQVVTTGSMNPISATSFTFKTTGTTNPATDITNAKLWFTGGNNAYSTTSQFGSTVASPNGTFSFTGNQTISGGTNYFWLSFDVPAGATLSNYIDAVCDSLTIAGINRIPSVTNPAGNRQIVDVYATIPYTQNFESAWTSLNSTRDVPDVHFVNTPATGDNSWRRQDDGSSASWTSSTGKVTPSGSSYAANFHSYDAALNTVGLLDLFINMSTTGSKQLTFNYQNASGSDSLRVYLSTNGGTTFGSQLLSLTSPYTWALQTVDLGTTTSSASVIRFRAVSDYGADDIGIDNLTVQIANPNSPPNAAVLVFPWSGKTNVYKPGLTLKWSAPSSGTAPIGYKIFLGTDASATNILNGSNLGNVLQYVIPGPNFNTKYYWKIVPYNANGDAASCPVWNFTVQTNNCFGGGLTGNGGYFFANSTSDGAGLGNQPSYNWITDTANKISAWTSGNSDDGYFRIPDIGFNFPYFDSTYRTNNVYISSNGFISFGTGSSAITSVQLPASGTPNNIIAGAMRDLDITASKYSSSKIYYGGDASKFVISFWHVYYYSSGTSTVYITFQIILYPDGTVKIQYNDAETSTPLTNAITNSCSVGLENYNGTKGINYRYATSDTAIIGAPIFSSPVAIQFSANESALPVELTSFVSEVNGRDVLLKWQTASEMNNKGFNIEKRRLDFEAGLWESAGFIDGNGTVFEKRNYSFTDRKLNTGKYKYRLRQVDYNGNFRYFSLSNDVEIGVPTKYNISQNYPNPFNPVTRIDYDLPENAFVNLKVYDITGREIAAVVNEYRPAGYYTSGFNAGNLSSGVYFYVINTEHFTKALRMVVLK